MSEPDTATLEPPRLSEVLDVAARLFFTKGYRATALAEIGEALGMNKASLYYYVRSKEDLLRRLILRAARRLRGASREAELEGLPALAALERMVREHCAAIMEHPYELGLLIQQRRFLDTETLGEVAEREKAYVARLRAVIERGIGEGALRPMDAGVAVQLVLDSVNGLLRWYRPEGRLPREAVVEEVWRFVCRGLVAEPGSPTSAARRR
ncbi:MAG: TetR/AcrR family transcriptional regulator [Elioraea sp.]|nr:TetR/AcrR family transcriptional regulator [Elioraea sp.]